MRSFLCLVQQFKFFHDIIDAFCTKRNTHATQFLAAKKCCEVVVPSSTSDASHFDLRRFYFQNCTGIIAEPTGQGRVKSQFIGKRLSVEVLEYLIDFCQAL